MDDVLTTAVSDNRDSLPPTSTESATGTLLSQIESQTNDNPSYVSAVKKTPHTPTPTKKQAIVMHAVEPLKLFDYVRALSQIVTPKNIIFASKISNQRICIYLASIQIVDNLVSTR